jgi:hypothetical protein
MSDPRTRITLELCLSEGPVEGQIEANGEEPRSFSGYAGLIAALESIRIANGGSHDGAGSSERESEEEVA